MVGIYGVGGIGKTTLAKALYNKLIADDQFEGLCFLENVREHSSGKHDGLLAYLQLQEKLLCKILGENFDIKLVSDSEGISLIKQRFQSMKVLLVLDDVDKLKQLQKLAGSANWFGFGSIIIITTRDERLLKSQMVARRYQVEEFDEKEALELLRWHAFKGENVDPSYMDILHKMVRYASGIPLALEVIGSNLYVRSVEEWISALDEYKKIPNKDIQEILRVSFDALEECHQKLFLDIACFSNIYVFEGYKDKLHALHDVNPIFGIRVLAERSLIKIYDEDGGVHVSLHDLIRYMGKEIVRQESPGNPGERSRLWIAEDVMQILEQSIGTNKIELIFLDAPMSKVIDWDGEAFKKMGNLKTLIVRGNFFNGPNHLPNSLRVLEWRGYPSHSLPPDFRPKKLSILKLPYNCLTQHQLVKLLKEFVDLTFLDFSGNDWITYIPDVSGAPNLKELRFRCCQNLVEIDESVGLLSNLEKLDVSRCPKLKSLPSLMLPSLLYLQITDCPSLESFPEISGKMENMTSLGLFNTSIRELPYSICNLTRLQHLSLEWGESETIVLPRSIFMLQELRELRIVRCKVLLSNEEEDREQGSSVSCAATTYLDLYSSNISDKFLEIILPQFPNLNKLNLSESNLRILPACIKSCQLLRFLHLNGCKNLQEIRGIPPNIKILNAVGTTSLSSSSREVVFNKELHEKIGKKRFIFPGTSIPSWFENQSSGQPISFWFRNQFPAISLCFLFKETGSKYNICPHMELICNSNGNDRYLFHDKGFMEAPDGHIWIYDLEDNGCQHFQQNEWNQALIPLPEITWSAEREVRPEEWARIIEIGVHIIKERSKMDDIKFTDPLLEKDDNKTLHMTDPHNHQPDTQLGLSLPPPSLSDEWEPNDFFPGYRTPWISRFQHWKVGKTGHY